jgi:membrane-bound lytic murein transglycosylase MltF
MTVTKQMFKDNSNKVGWNILASLAYSESSYNPKAKSRAGAIGLMQFMPDTWQQWASPGANPYDPEESIRAADNYLHFLKEQLKGNVHEALIAYMWGIGRVLEKGSHNAPLGVKERAAMIQFVADALWGWENTVGGNV